VRDVRCTCQRANRRVRRGEQRWRPRCSPEGLLWGPHVPALDCRGTLSGVWYHFVHTRCYCYSCCCVCRPLFRRCELQNSESTVATTAPQTPPTADRIAARDQTRSVLVVFLDSYLLLLKVNALFRLVPAELLRATRTRGAPEICRPGILT
jgi:hypothetical protein